MTETTFTNVAGKYDGEEENIKFIGEEHADLGKALLDYITSIGYPINRIEVCRKGGEKIGEFIPDPEWIEGRK